MDTVTVGSPIDVVYGRR